jgi:hypothetical protein
MRSDTERHGGTAQGTVALAASDDPFRIWRDLQDPLEPTGDTTGRTPTSVPAAPVPAPDGAPWSTSLEPGTLDELDHPRLVITDGYIGVDRRRTGLRAAVGRATHGERRNLLRLDILIVAVVVALVVGAVLLVTARTAPRYHRQSGSTEIAAALPTNPLRTVTRVTTPPTATVPTTVPTTVAAPVPTGAPAVVAATPSPAPTTPATTVPTAAAAPPAPAATPTTPAAMGAAALALVRYPWQQIPGYSIDFLPISDAPSPGFYGNTDFTWGVTGGVSTLYVYPGETVERLAGIIGFEIGHEVDAAYVEPQGGHAEIEAALGVYPASWAPECDCAEQGYLSGWYAAAFSDYWTPGVGDWSTLAPPPSGGTLAAVEPWLDPRVS